MSLRAVCVAGVTVAVLFLGESAQAITSQALYPSNPDPMGFIQCATENQGGCAWGTGIIAYGAADQFNYGYQANTNVRACSNDLFGDPLPDETKHCYFAPYEVIAEEDDNTDLTFAPRFGTTGEVAYGASGHFKYATLSRGQTYRCSNELFGDPMPRVHKECFLALPNYVRYLESDGVGDIGPRLRPVAYGAHGMFVYKMLSGQIKCSPEYFDGQDPAWGVYKACYVLAGTPVGTEWSDPNFTLSGCSQACWQTSRSAQI